MIARLESTEVSIRLVGAPATKVVGGIDQAFCACLRCAVGPAASAQVGRELGKSRYEAEQNVKVNCVVSCTFSYSEYRVLTC